MERGAAQILDEYLVAAAKSGERRAFAMLAQRWNGKLIAHAWRLTGDVDAARDATQAAWADIVRGLGRLRDERAFAAWAYRVVSRRCAEQVGSAVRGRRLTESLATVPEPRVADPAEALDRRRLRAAIDALPPDQRSAIALFYLEEMSVAEVAVALAVPIGTVKTRLMHARAKLRRALEGED